MKGGLRDIPGFAWGVFAGLIILAGFFILIDFCSIKPKKERTIQFEETVIEVPRNYVEVREYTWEGTTLTIDFKTYDEKITERY